MISFVFADTRCSNSAMSKPKPDLLAQRDRDRHAAGEVDDRLVDRESRVGIDALVAATDQRQDGEEHDRLGARGHHDLLGRDRHPARLPDVLGDGLAQLGQAGGGAIVRGVRVERALGGLLDVRRRVEIGLTDLEVHDLAALTLERARPRQHLERRLGPQPSHTFRDVHRVLLLSRWGAPKWPPMPPRVLGAPRRSRVAPRRLLGDRVPAHCAAPRIPWRLLGDRFAIGCPLSARHLASRGAARRSLRDRVPAHCVAPRIPWRCSAIASRSGARSVRGTSHPVASARRSLRDRVPAQCAAPRAPWRCSAIASRSGARSSAGIPRAPRRSGARQAWHP